MCTLPMHLLEQNRFSKRYTETRRKPRATSLGHFSWRGMLKVHKDAIQKTKSNIIETIQLNGRFWDLLMEKGVFLPIMMDFIKRKTTREGRNRKLVEDIVRRGPGKYELFLDCLREGGYPQLADNIVRNEWASHPLLAVPEACSSNDVEDLWEKHSVVPSKVEYPVGVPLGPSTCIYERETKYPMKSPIRGYVLIINNSEFDDPRKNRKGSNLDRYKLEDMFIYLGFKIDNAENQTAEEMKNEIKKFASRRELKQVDSIAVAVLSHGTTSGKIYGIDENYILESDITESMNAQSCPDMADKPKLIILNACRGGARDQSVTGTVPLVSDCDGNITAIEDTNDDIEAMSNEDQKVKYQDFIIAYCTYSGFVGYRFEETGSVFIQLLNEVFKAKAHQEHVETLLKEVRRLVVEYCKTKKLKIQLPETRQTLMHSWYMNPPHPPE